MYELWEHGHVMDGLQTVQDTDLLTSNEYTVIVIESAQISLEAFRQMRGNCRLDHMLSGSVVVGCLPLLHSW